MSRFCAICGKGVSFGKKVSHSNRRTNRTWQANLQSVRILLKGKVTRAKVCTGCLKKVTKA